ncbi:MAG: hypothetical protein PHZ09_01480 [Eubacteriales bacterium]|jgi:glucosamine-6-phosphate deaminase|nr:hypothetical protein [Eubacteriales bacterium]
MDFNSTVKGSLLEGFYPAGWDMEKIDSLMQCSPEDAVAVQPHWNGEFTPVECENIYDFNTYMGHEIAIQIKNAREKGEKLIFILPVGPMGMYRWAVFFLRSWNVKCDHLYCFNMDEWSDSDGVTLPQDSSAAFRFAMEQALYDPLGELTVPPSQRNFATLENLPLYASKIAALKAEGAKQILVFGIGRMCHIAFWEPQFAAEFSSVDEWKVQTHRIGAKLHPLTIEQNAVTSFKSRTTLVPCRANTIGPGIFLQSDYIIGGCDGVLGRGMQWQGMSFHMTLKYGPDMWIPSSFMPTLPGKLFYLKELAGPLSPDCN